MLSSIPWSTILPPLATALGYLLRHFIGEYKWVLIRKTALNILQDPDDTDEPKEAFAKAIIVVNKDRVEKEIKVLNGHAKRKN
jgi:hypothetical protein